MPVPRPWLPRDIPLTRCRDPPAPTPVEVRPPGAEASEASETNAPRPTDWVEIVGFPLHWTITHYRGVYAVSIMTAIGVCRCKLYPAGFVSDRRCLQFLIFGLLLQTEVVMYVACPRNVCI